MKLGVKKMKKFFGILILALVALVATNAYAQSLSFTGLEINGKSVLGQDVVLNVERGDIIDISAELKATDDSSGVKLKAWIGGYEYDEIEDVTDIFDVEKGVTYIKELVLEVPEDVDASEDYTLHVEAFDKNDRVKESFVLRVKEQRHALDVYDVLFSPGLTVNAGDDLFARVRVENLGYKTERNIRIEVSVPELGVARAAYLDELVPQTKDDKDTESSASSNELWLPIPSDAPKGNYDLDVVVEYQRGNEVVRDTYTLTVKEGAPTIAEEGLMVNSDVIVQNIAQGKGTAYTVSLANLAENARTFTVDVVGEDAFATARIDPSMVTLQADGTGEVVVYLSVKEDASLGEQSFRVNVNENGRLVKELTLKANVGGVAAAEGDWASVKTGLEIGFIILLIILVILGIVVLISRAGRGRGEAEAPSGETYY